MNNMLPGISGWPPSPRGQILAPFCTSAKPFHASETYSAKSSKISAGPSPAAPSLPVPHSVPTTCEAAPAVENCVGGENMGTTSLVAGKPPLPIPTATAAAASTATDAVAARAPPCEAIPTRLGDAEGGLASTTTKTAFLSSSPPAANTSPAGETHTAWSPSPPRTAARHALKPIHVSSAAASTAAGAAAAAAAAATLVAARSFSEPISALPPSSGFSHKLRRRLLHAPDGEASRCSGSHVRRRTASDMAAVVLAAEGSGVAAGSRDAKGPKEETSQRPGLKNRSSSFVDATSLSRCQPSIIRSNQYDEQGRGTESLRSATRSGANISRSISWEPSYNTSAEPPPGVEGGSCLQRRSSIPSLRNLTITSSRSNSSEFGPQNVEEPPCSKGEQAPPAVPPGAPSGSRRTPASSPHAIPFASSDRGLRISPLHRSDSVRSVSEADPDEESCAASFFLSGSLSLDGALRPPTPLVCCSPPALAELNCISRAGGRSKTGSGITGYHQNTGLGSRGGRYTRRSPHKVGGRSVDDAPGNPQQQQKKEQLDNAPLREAETPKLTRQNSYFDKRAPSATHGPQQTGRTLRETLPQNREPPEGQARSRNYDGKLGCEVHPAHAGATDCSAPFPKVRLPSPSAPPVPDRQHNNVQRLSQYGEGHGSNASDHYVERLHRHLPPGSREGGTTKHATDKHSADPPLSTCDGGSSAEEHRSQHLDHDGSGIRMIGESLGAADGGGGGGASLPATLTQSAGGPAAENSSQASQLVRRNDSILKSLLTGGGLDPVVGFPDDVRGVRAPYEFGLWKKKAREKDSIARNKVLSFPACPLVATPATAKREGIEPDSELPPPPLKGLPTNARPNAPFPHALERGIEGIATRKPSQVPIVAKPGGYELAGLDGRRTPPRSPRRAVAVTAALPGFTNNAAGQLREKMRTNYPDLSAGCEENDESTSTISCRPNMDGTERVSATKCGTTPLLAAEAETSGGLKESARLSSSGTSLCPLPRGSPAAETPSPSPLPSPRQSPKLSPRAARAGTRPCAEENRPSDVRTEGRDPGHVRRLKASPPLIASRFPLSSKVWTGGGACDALRIRGRSEESQGSNRDDRNTSRSCSGGSSSGAGSFENEEGPRSSRGRGAIAPPVVLGDSRRHDPSHCKTLVDVRDRSPSDRARPHKQGATHSSANRRNSPPEQGTVGTRHLSCSNASHQDDHVAGMLVGSGPSPAGNEDALTQRLARPQTESVQVAITTAFREAETAGRPEENLPVPGTHVSEVGQDIPIPSPTDDLSDSLTVEVSTDFSADLFDESDSGRGSCRDGGKWVADRGCHTGVSLHPRRNAIHWKRGEQIGMGSFGKVFKGLNESTGELFAVKQISLKRGLKEDINTLEAEIDLMKDLDHRHIVRYCGTDRGTRHLYIFLEYVPGGSIASMLEQFGLFREDLVRRFMHQILLGMRYLHEKGIIHRDVKGANVLVTEQGIAKLADFGCSKQFQGVRTPSFDDSLQTIRGSIPWMAPEMIKQTGHGRSADVWSVGATMIEMYTARYPWPPFSNNIAAMYHVATATEPPAFPKNASREATDFLSKCLIIDPDKRLKASELLQHPFLLVAAAELEASSGQGPGGFGATDSAAEPNADSA